MVFKKYFSQLNTTTLTCWTLVSIFMLLLLSCITPHEPIETMDKSIVSREKIVEDTLREKYGEDLYISMAFGQLTVYKPPSFQQLDSLYAIKKDYIDNDDLRGLHQSGIEDIIPGYRAQAQNDIDQVKYELEHIFGVKNNDSIRVMHTYFTFNHSDEIQSISNLYDYIIHKKYEELHEKYLYGYHFTTNRDLYISKAENQFLELFKQREWELAQEEKGLDSFMNHTFSLMELAQKINSVDFRTLAKFSSIQKLKSLHSGASITIEEFGELMMLENANNRVIGYEFKIIWKAEGSSLKATIFSFSPFLKHKSYITQNYEN